MGAIYADIELINENDIHLARRYHIGEEEIRRVNLNIMVNSGAIPLEEMDVLIHPLRQELIVNPEHPDGAILRI